MRLGSVFGAFALVLALAGRARAQSTDALLHKLVEKGVLTTQEADELRAEANKDFATTYQAKTDLPEWVTGLKFSGDLRMRYDSDYFDAPDVADWQRFRFRLRFGMVALLRDNFEVGFRLASSVGNPLSVNQTFENNASKKEIRIDLAYARWTPVHTLAWGLNLTAGKMENPFGIQSLLFDSDYTPEGAAQQVFWNLSRQHTLTVTAGEFIVNDVSNSGVDPSILAGQIRIDSAWSRHWQTSLSVMGLGLLHATGVPAGALIAYTNANGNTHTGLGAARSLAYDLTPWQVEGAVMYFLEPNPIFRGPLPLRLAAQIIKNPSAPDRNTGWLVGGSIGKAGRKGTWEISYKYRWLEGDAWWESIEDDDSFAVYGRNSAYGSKGVHPGTNLRSHIVAILYAPTDFLLLGVRYYRCALIDNVPAGFPSGADRLFVDAMWKF